MTKRRINSASDVARQRLNPNIKEDFGKKSALTVEKFPRQSEKNFENTPRLSKVLAQKGLASRREADFLIESGWVLINGKKAVLGQRVLENADIQILKKGEKIQKERRTIILNKPLGFVSNLPEKDYPHALSLIKEENLIQQNKNEQFYPALLKKLAPAGRLDINSTGLMIYTQNGKLADSIIGEKSNIEKEYLVRVSGELTTENLKLLNYGLHLDGALLKPARVKMLNENQLHFILKEGKKRQIRRMCALVGLEVLSLKRIRIGRLKLGNLPLGKWRFLQDFEKI